MRVWPGKRAGPHCLSLAMLPHAGCKPAAVGRKFRERASRRQWRGCRRSCATGILKSVPHLIARKPSKQTYFCTDMMSTNPALLSWSTLPFVEKGSRMPLRLRDFATISSES